VAIGAPNRNITHLGPPLSATWRDAGANDELLASS
jgi:hypothetical protein